MGCRITQLSGTEYYKLQVYWKFPGKPYEVEMLDRLYSYDKATKECKKRLKKLTEELKKRYAPKRGKKREILQLSCL